MTQATKSSFDNKEEAIKNQIKVKTVKNLIKRIKLHYEEIKPIIEQKKREFLRLQNSTENDIFKELCFCILAANFSAEGSLKIQQKLNDKLLTLPLKELSITLKHLHRFPNTRAKYIVEARELKHEIWKKIQEIKKIKYEEMKESELQNFRSWLVKNIKGLGMKEASHFLRNIGFFDFAIIDFHIIDILVENQIIEKPKTLTKKKYVEIENILKGIANQVNLKPGILDLVLWHMETGKIIK